MTLPDTTFPAAIFPETSSPKTSSPETIRPTVQSCIDEGERLFTGAGLFYGHGTDNAADEALWLVFHQLGLDFASDQSILGRTVSDLEQRQIRRLFQRRIEERLPAAYLTGEAWFAGYPFSVNPAVLVPRSPIGALIANGFQPWLTTEPRAILDLCTGCGCIGIATALLHPGARVTLSDLSPQAIAVARQNIARHRLGDRVVAIASDGFERLAGRRFDLIVCNPPYVNARDLAAMPAEYWAEPELALASGEDGLDFTRRLLREAADYLTDSGVLIAEVGNCWLDLEAAFPGVAFLWLELQYGGEGVFVMTRQELLALSQ